MTVKGINEAMHLSVSILRDWREVYDFVADPRNLPHWAAGLGKSVRQVDGEWWASTGQGEVKVRFAASNELGVLDHVVAIGPGKEVHVPMRVVANGGGCEVVFTLYRQPGMSDEKYDEDAGLVEQALETLKRVLEE